MHQYFQPFFIVFIGFLEYTKKYGDRDHKIDQPVFTLRYVLVLYYLVLN